MEVSTRTKGSSIDALQQQNRVQRLPMICEKCHYKFDISNNPNLNPLCPYCGSNWINIRENEVSKIVGNVI
ncbi:hypothetical protein HYU14_03085 [Candidatus Woesearchaeota archaeon]|nr:hypothetical protein [Candidatus Woesearchaeota archaeon]